MVRVPSANMFRRKDSKSSSRIIDTNVTLSGQATKGLRWIPRHTEAKKDVVTDDTHRGVGSKQ